ncbi:glycosyltransferase family 4 protein [Cryobacterium sp. CG_9.6]|uniref:glycosyltransferase family 4 protein n=1 Tax=Cryobacterium sp. CG_9.6 TaxID=2760710 RepID=UPI002476D137|nr:glycosyltransferase family 4 protein [Cryobacterium sp. CG_9.6]MDH6238273.1 glycosyltransferase involved in cell wall biosynthesis [Cryobacterium sp. CG_9.6]
MRVLYSFPHSLDRAGIALTARQQVLGLAQLGVQVVLFCTSVGTLVLPSSVEVHETMMVGTFRVPHRALGVQRAYTFHDIQVAGWLRKNTKRIDVVHAWPRACLHTFTTATKAGIATLRESPNPHTASVIRQSALAAADAGVPLPPQHSHAANLTVLARECAEYEAATAVLVPSDYARDEFIVEGFPSSRMLQHRYGCDLTRFAARTCDPSASPRPFRAVFVGRGDPTKGLHVALDSWRSAGLADAELLIAGSIQPDYGRSLSALLAQPNVTTLGFVDDIPALLRSADVLLLPTWTEGSALVTLEAQASGCVPLVSSASGALGTPGIDFLEHAVGSRQALAEHLVLLATTPALLKRLSARGSAQRQFLSWDRASESLARCYDEVVQRDR